MQSVASIEVREPVLVPKHTKEHNRIMFNLKMSLRMNNGIFDVFEVHKFINRGVNFEEDYEKTTIECWYKPKSAGDMNSIVRQQGLFISEGSFEEFRTGSIIDHDE